MAAQEINNGFKLDLSIRYRFESWNGMNAKNYGNDGPDAIGELNDKFLLQRIILGTTYTHSKNLSTAFHLQESRAFGWSLRKEYPDFLISARRIRAPYYNESSGKVFRDHDLYGI
jgi:hypothetical protein